MKNILLAAAVIQFLGTLSALSDSKDNVDATFYSGNWSLNKNMAQTDSINLTGNNFRTDKFTPFHKDFLFQVDCTETLVKNEKNTYKMVAFRNNSGSKDLDFFGGGSTYLHATGLEISKESGKTVADKCSWRILDKEEPDFIEYSWSIPYSPNFVTERIIASFDHDIEFVFSVDRALLCDSVVVMIREESTSSAKFLATHSRRCGRI